MGVALTVPRSVHYARESKSMKRKDIVINNVDLDILEKQYKELQWLLDGVPQSNLWGLVEMIGDVLQNEQ